MYAKKEKIYPAYVSKHDSNCEKQAIDLMIPDREKREVNSGERWHYHAVKKLLTLLTGITSKSNGDFFCLNCLHSFKTKNNLKSHKKVCENKDFCNVAMPSEDTKILELNQYRKSDKAPFVIYADLECIIERLMDAKIIPKIKLQQT